MQPRSPLIGIFGSRLHSKLEAREIKLPHDSQNGKSKRGAAKRILQIQEVLDNLEVKPEKGRRKDLKRIEKTVAAMLQVTA